MDKLPYMWRTEDNLQELVLPFHFVLSGGWTLVIRLGRACLYPRSQLDGLVFVACLLVITSHTAQTGLYFPNAVQIKDVSWRPASTFSNKESGDKELNPGTKNRLRKRLCWMGQYTPGISNTWGGGDQNQELQVILSYTGNLKSIWALKDQSWKAVECGGSHL